LNTRKQEHDARSAHSPAFSCAPFRQATIISAPAPTAWQGGSFSCPTDQAENHAKESENNGAGTRKNDVIAGLRNVIKEGQATAAAQNSTEDATEHRPFRSHGISAQKKAGAIPAF
jgi:hypothetical protein